MTKKKNRKEIKEGRPLTWTYLAQLQLAAQPIRQSVCLQPLPVGRGVSTHVRSLWPAPCLLPPSPDPFERHGDSQHHIAPLPSLPWTPSPPLLSVWHHRTHPPPLTSTTTATGPPSPIHCVRKNRRNSVFLIVDVLKPGRPVEPPPPSSSSSGNRDRRRDFVASEPPPSTLSSSATSQ